jgi:hypothetical protein
MTSINSLIVKGFPVSISFIESSVDVLLTTLKPTGFQKLSGRGD